MSAMFNSPFDTTIVTNDRIQKHHIGSLIFHTDRSQHTFTVCAESVSTQTGSFTWSFKRHTEIVSKCSTSVAWQRCAPFHHVLGDIRIEFYSKLLDRSYPICIASSPCSISRPSADSVYEVLLDQKASRAGVYCKAAIKPATWCPYNNSGEYWIMSIIIPRLTEVFDVEFINAHSPPRLRCTVIDAEIAETQRRLKTLENEKQNAMRALNTQQPSC